jgi:hypothetical protein
VRGFQFENFEKGGEKVKNRILFVSLAVVLALSVGLISCGGEEVPEITEYNLVISSTEGGSVTTPGEGTFTYDEGTDVNLVAMANEGYIFDEWIGDVGTIANVEDADTTITMNDHYSITANFALETQEIWDWHDLDAIRDNLGGRYVLMNDLDSTTAGYEELASATANGGKGWEPIGSVSVDPSNPYSAFPVDPFNGSLDGQGYEIRDLFINRPDEDGVGLFGSFGVKGVVENLGMMDVAVTGHSHVGGLVGCVIYQSNTVSNSYSTGSVTGDKYVGGLVGSNYAGTVSDCYSTGSVTGGLYVGGLVGVNGFAYVRNSYSTGSVTGDEEVGGLVGSNSRSVSNSFWDTETSGQSTSAGGTGKTTAEMQDIATFSGAAWDICAVNPGETNLTYTWNIVDGETYPFLSWQPVS